jgi:hypothetical protein
MSGSFRVSLPRQSPIPKPSREPAKAGAGCGAVSATFRGVSKMSNDTTHNGYRNYETWSIAFVAIQQQQDTQLVWQQAARLAWQEAESTEVFSKSESARFNLADTLKDHFQESAEEQSEKLAGHFQQLLTQGLANVNWEEIANGLLETAVGDAYQSSK